MAEVITWRQMAGPNFSGAAAAMDAAGDRLKQGTDLFTQFAGDQTKQYQQQKAKLKADNTARALTEIAAMRDLGQLDAAAPALTFESLKGKWGEDIDAGAVAQAGINQRGVIQQNQLNDIKFNESKLLAEEAPIVGEAKEAMAAAVASGDKAKMAEIEAFYTPKLRDASFLGKARQDFDEQQFNRNLQQNQETRAQKTFDQASSDRQAEVDAFNLVKDISTGKMNTADAAARIRTPEGLQAFTTAITQSEAFNALPKDKQLEIDLDNNNRVLANTKKSEEAKMLLQRIKEEHPQEDPSVMAYRSSIGGERQKLINTLGTSTAVLANKVRELGIQGADWGFEITEKEADSVDDYVRNKLKERGVDMDEVDPIAMDAALSNLQKNSEGKLDESALDQSINNIKKFSEKLQTYKDNTKQYKTLEKDILTEERDMNNVASQIAAKKLRLAELNNKIDVAQQNLGTLDFNGGQKGYDEARKGKEFINWENELMQTIDDISKLEASLPKKLDYLSLAEKHGYGTSKKK